MNTKAIEQYCQTIKRKLVCSKKTKETLIGGLRNEIESKALPEKLTIQWLEDEVGNASEVAEELQESVSPDEYRQARKSKILMITAIMICSIAVLLAGFKLYVNYVRENEVGYVETIIVIEGQDDEFIGSLPEVTDAIYVEAPHNE